jgi:hypothetical protein
MKRSFSIRFDVFAWRCGNVIISFFFAISVGLLPSCEQKAPEKERAGNSIEAGVGSLLSESELPNAVERFNRGEIKLAWRLQTTYNAKKNEIVASVYARSLSIQENDPNAIAVQSFMLSQLEKSAAVCEAMRLNLEVWARWKDDKFHKYVDGKRQYERTCL